MIIVGKTNGNVLFPNVPQWTNNAKKQQLEKSILEEKLMNVYSNENIDNILDDLLKELQSFNYLCEI